ncbi:MAG TPA: hypothetical protein VFT74_03760, partial [Isosphaeraceae bacterium]|nr:hypothetical protein [Isosphaeraceae bacterium]
MAGRRRRPLAHNRRIRDTDPDRSDSRFRENERAEPSVTLQSKERGLFNHLSTGLIVTACAGLAL